MSAEMRHRRFARTRGSESHKCRSLYKKGKAAGLFINRRRRNDIYSKNLLICTGSRPKELEIPGADITDVSDVYNLDTIPRSAVIIGGGASGLEAAEYLNALGCRVSVIEQAERNRPDYGQRHKRIFAAQSQKERDKYSHFVQGRFGGR